MDTMTYGYLSHVGHRALPGFVSDITNSPAAVRVIAPAVTRTMAPCSRMRLETFSITFWVVGGFSNHDGTGPGGNPASGGNFSSSSFFSITRKPGRV
jgi:hypothetical protein